MNNHLEIHINSKIIVPFWVNSIYISAFIPRYKSVFWLGIFGFFLAEILNCLLVQMPVNCAADNLIQILYFKVHHCSFWVSRQLYPFQTLSFFHHLGTEFMEEEVFYSYASRALFSRLLEKTFWENISEFFGDKHPC